MASLFPREDDSGSELKPPAASGANAPTQKGFSPLRIVGVTLLLLLAISAWIRWYSSAVSIPRYCQSPQQSLRLLEHILREERPAGEQARRTYMVVAKLLFLLPQEADEPIDAYLRRIEHHLLVHCR